MAYAIANPGLALTTTLQTVYTCPAGKRATVTHCQVCNVGSAETDATVQRTVAAQEAAVIRLVRNLPVPVACAIPPVTGSLVLLAGDALAAQASADASLELSLTVIEEDV